MNKGGHPAGSAFELVSWSQGEVRHNTWHSKGRENVPASAARRRMLYLVGLGAELEAALRAIAKATVRKPFAFAMAREDARSGVTFWICTPSQPRVTLPWSLI